MLADLCSDKRHATLKCCLPLWLCWDFRDVLYVELCFICQLPLTVLWQHS